MLPDVISRATPVATVVVFKFSCCPTVPTVPSNTVAPVESSMRNQPAVPSATPVAVTGGVASNVITPAAGPVKAGSAKVKVASKVPVAGSCAEAGCAPVRTWMLPGPAPVSVRAATAAAAALRAAVESLVATFHPPYRLIVVSMKLAGAEASATLMVNTPG